MDEYQREAKSSEYMDICHCPKCPSYTRCVLLRSQKVFCLRGKCPTNCIGEKRGCVCDGCPVAHELDPKESYYCIEKEY